MITAAFLIVAHEQPALFGRLVDRLSSPRHKILAHIDARADEAAFRHHAAGRDVLYADAKSRVDIRYAGLGLSVATLNMVSTALSLSSVDQIFLLSGVDYPLAPVDEIVARASGLDLLRIDRELRADRDQWFDKTAFRFDFSDIRALNSRTGSARLRHWTSTITGRWRRKQPPFHVMHGPAFWSVTRPSATLMLATIQHLGLLRWARFRRSPEEFIFQTAYRAAGLQASLPIPPGAANTSLHATHYVDFAIPGSSSPKILSVSDYEAVAMSGALFARKMSSDRSVELMAMIDKHLL